MSLPESSPITILLAQIRELQKAVPFVPFRLVTSSGEIYPVPTADHISIMAVSGRIIVEKDSGEACNVSPLHVSAIEVVKWVPVAAAKTAGA